MSRNVSARKPRGSGLPMPTSETIPYVAEVMGAASYEETVEDEEPTEVKRVQRKLSQPEENDRELDPEQQEFHEYQGVMGRPGVDFPVLPKIPRTDFSCRKVKSSGYYADLETGCQVFHICDGGRKISFLCPNGTIFRQSHLICDWWFRVNCEKSLEQYEESAEQLAHDQMVYRKRVEELARAMAGERDQPTTLPTTTERVSNYRQSRRKQDFPNEPAKKLSFTGNLQNNIETFNRPDPDRERQVLAETASFASNRHRFGQNQVERNGYATTENALPFTYSTSAPLERNFNINPYRAVNPQYTTQSTPLPLNRNNYNYNNFNENKENQFTTAAPSTYAQPISTQQNYQSSYSPQYTQQSFQPSYTQQTYPLSQSTTYDPSQVSLTTPTYESRPPPNQSPVFNVKVTPNKDYSFLELHPVPTFTDAPSPSNVYSSPNYAQVQDTYNLVNETRNATFRYATFNNSGVQEEIRPEIVNSLMETGVAPTSAKALHSLVSYYGSAEGGEIDFKTTKPHVSDVVLNLRTDTEETSTTETITSTNGEDLPSVLTKATKDSYSYLFSDSKEQTDPKNDLITKETSAAALDGKRNHNRETSYTTTTTTTTTLRPEETRFKDSSELRELAQVFSRALSAYLEDPKTFKEILAQVRPTEPNSQETTPSPDDEVLDFSDTSQSRTGTTVPPTTINEDFSIGEINSLVTATRSFEPDNSIENSSVSIRQVDSIELTTPLPTTTISDYYAKLGSAEDPSYFPTVGSVSDATRPRYGGFQNNAPDRKNYAPYGSDLPANVTRGSPISTDSEETISSEEVTTTSSPLADAQQVNTLLGGNILHSPAFSSEEITDPIDSNEEKLLVASNSQSFVSSQNYATFAKNFNNEQKLYGKDYNGQSSAAAVNSFVSGVGPYFGQKSPYVSVSIPSAFQTQRPVKVSEPDAQGTTWTASPVTTQFISETPSQNVTTVVQPTTYHPHSVPESSTELPLDPMAQKAKEMFGALNETAVGALMSAMHQAESNMTIRRLVLLLVSDKGKENKTSEESRSRLINALLTSENEDKTSKSSKKKVKVMRVRSGSRALNSKVVRGTDSMTNSPGEKTTELTNKENSAKLYIPIPTSTTAEPKIPFDSDARAVELLKTLYTLAAKWG